MASCYNAGGRGGTHSVSVPLLPGYQTASPAELSDLHDIRSRISHFLEDPVIKDGRSSSNQVTEVCDSFGRLSIFLLEEYKQPSDAMRSR